MKGRAPNYIDLERLQAALALVTAYEGGCGDDEFDTYQRLLDEIGGNPDITDAVVQLAWLLVSSIEQTGAAQSRDDVLAWYGQRLATRVEELR